MFLSTHRAQLTLPVVVQCSFTHILHVLSSVSRNEVHLPLHRHPELWLHLPSTFYHLLPSSFVLSRPAIPISKSGESSDNVCTNESSPYSGPPGTCPRVSRENRPTLEPGVAFRRCNSADTGSLLDQSQWVCFAPGHWIPHLRR